MTLLLLLIGGAVAWPFLYGPYLVYSTSTFPVMPQYIPRRPEEFPPDARRYLSQCEFILGGQGFFTLYYLEFALKSGGKSFTAVMFNPRTRDMAKVAMIEATAGAKTLKVPVTFFVTKYLDGHEVITYNSDGASMFYQRLPRIHGQTFPEVKDVRYLFQIHRERAIRFAPQTQTVFPQMGEEWGFFYNSEWQGFAERAERGAEIYRSGSEYRFRFPAALRAAWGLTSPVLNIRKYLHQQKARAVLRELGM
ncbi:MAG: hypothetical protein K1Y36_12550 [Blastocatellia bacterium]|nr:hypothetical protein [Blastocatellia bacterium]